MPKRADTAPRQGSDSALWQQAMHDVAPLAPRPAPPKARSAERAKPLARQAAPPPPAFHDLPPLTLDRSAGIDKASALRLKRGKLAIEARLDLHGMTQDEAHGALAGFIRTARAGGKRCVLVITGRGAVGGGVLRAAVPRWLAEPEFRPHLLAIATAQPQDGGAGALYVMLRRTDRMTGR
jgi:DNA-nicking Smr family endonuclease